jgi:plasmid replication initiation protein
MKELVVKTNRLNEAMHNLDLIENRLIHMGIVRFRENPIFSADTKVIISASDYAKLFDVDRVSAHQALLEAEKSLFARQFTIINENGKPEKTRWIQSVEYLNGENALGIRFSTIVVKGISRIDGNNDPFTSYYLEQIAPLKSRYSVRLYELLKQWVKKKETPEFELEKFRFQLGIAPSEYTKISNFKARVLNVAINEINEKTDFEVTCHQQKTGREVTGFKFKIKTKKQVIDNNKDLTGVKIAKQLTSDDADISLTDNEIATIKSMAEKYIVNNNIVDDKHKANIHKKAMAEKWGLGDIDKQADDYNAQNAKVLASIEQEKLSVQSEIEKLVQEKKINNDFMSYYERLSDDKKAETIRKVRNEFKSIPMFLDSFDKDPNNAYKDIMFSATFKKVMSYPVD